jgi:hypothetical protein
LLPLSVVGDGPNLEPAPHDGITDTVSVILGLPQRGTAGTVPGEKAGRDPARTDSTQSRMLFTAFHRTYLQD